ncbi:unnamed protein product [Anisakis simplex]|uniref:Protein lethal(2)essential for life (inferred by orthology to a D. melanogaster protein) n=1 Tax=Anisakis simplex TaxID=6269 RepID=A0A0M3K080_ANISI|nr:unnamed protein product [Anisakis simplex]
MPLKFAVPFGLRSSSRFLGLAIQLAEDGCSCATRSFSIYLQYYLPQIAYDAIVLFSSHLDRMDKNWRSDPFWRDLYPRWAEPIFKEGIDIKTKITNDSERFAVDVDAYQFRPEEIQVKTVDDTLLIEGRHEDVRDRDNFTKMYFVRKYQLPSDIDPVDVCSSIDSSGRLTVEAVKRQRYVAGRERVIPIEGPSRRGETRTQFRSESPRERDRSESETYHSTETQERRSPQTHSSHTYYHETSRSGGTQGATQPQQITTHFAPRTDDQRSFETREKREREYRSEVNKEYRSESRDSHRDQYHQDGSLDRTRYRVDSPSASNRQNGSTNYDGANKTESKSSVRSVQILRKTFQ